MSRFESTKTFYRGLVDFSSALQSLLLLSMRLFWGYQLATGGWSKLHTISEVAVFFAKLGIPLPLFNAYFVGGLETICGLLLLLGLATRLAALPVMAIMAVAFMTAHVESLRTLVEDPMNFVKQDPFTFFLCALILFVFGPGKISFDYFFEKSNRK